MFLHVVRREVEKVRDLHQLGVGVLARGYAVVLRLLHSTFRDSIYIHFNSFPQLRTIQANPGSALKHDFKANQHTTLKHDRAVTAELIAIAKPKR